MARNAKKFHTTEDSKWLSALHDCDNVHAHSHGVFINRDSTVFYLYVYIVSCLVSAVLNIEHLLVINFVLL